MAVEDQRDRLRASRGPCRACKLHRGSKLTHLRQPTCSRAGRSAARNHITARRPTHITAGPHQAVLLAGRQVGQGVVQAQRRARARQRTQILGINVDVVLVRLLQ